MKKTIITRFDDKPYLIRWSIFPWLKVHKILLSDSECLHDHPWAFISFIIRGGYVEERVKEWYYIDGLKTETILESARLTNQRAVFDYKNNRYGFTKKRIYGPLSILWRPAKTAHRLEVYDQPAWTLVITFKRIRLWGFFTNMGWVPWNRHNNHNQCD